MSGNGTLPPHQRIALAAMLRKLARELDTGKVSPGEAVERMLVMARELERYKPPK